MRLFLLLFLSACSGVQGIPMAPRAPVFSPVEDAPIEIGHPGARTAPPPPRGTDRRVLPPTKGPGIWASDDPRANGPRPHVHVLSIVLEPPTSPTEYEWDTVATCGVTLVRAGGAELKALSRLADWPRACAVSKMYRACIEGVAREAKRKKAAGEEYDAAVAVALQRLLQAATAQEKITCKTEPDAETTTAMRAIMARWTREHETP